MHRRREKRGGRGREFTTDARLLHAKASHRRGKGRRKRREGTYPRSPRQFDGPARLLQFDAKCDDKGMGMRGMRKDLH